MTTPPESAEQWQRTMKSARQCGSGKSCSLQSDPTRCYASTDRRSRQVTYSAVCSKRATPLGNVDRANRKPQCGRNLTKHWILSDQLFGPGGNTTLEYWIDGRRIRAAWKAPPRKRPCRSRALPVDPSFFVSRRAPSDGIKRFLHRLVRHRNA
jgi:hypothetical protein